MKVGGSHAARVGGYLGFQYERWPRLLVGALVGLIFLYLSLKDAQVSTLAAVMVRVDYRLVVLAVVIVLGAPLVRAMRWRLLFYPDHLDLRLARLYSIVLIGQMVNIIAPARLGEPVRAYLLGRIEGKNKVSALATVVVEKSIDALILLAAFVALVALVPVPPWLRAPKMSMIVAATCVLLLVLVPRAQREFWRVLVRLALTMMPGGTGSRVEYYVGLIRNSLNVLSYPRISLPVVGCSVAIWALGALINYLLFLALGLDLPFLAANFLLLVLQLGTAVPSSPGKLGVFHYLCVTALSVFSVDRSLALGYAILLYGVVVVPSTIGGVLMLWRESVTLQSMEQAAVDPEAWPVGSPLVQGSPKT